ncbi:FadR/GntR family transcriptional regulator [Nocardia abscessus]|uniref:FadR/GntR family transcriptional regulator n=1 Tax=Nocardia abscessus TaxID=120957 RepID=UPI0002EC3F5D|nr:FCD domain-containing protein [Nocardia abscessus]MCC3332198.1 FCD domain-containing protein [Nocardia abscessus]
MNDSEPLLAPRTSRAEEIAHSLEARITAQMLPIGHRLGTRESLRSEFGVAPATLSEAVRLLSARGAVTVRPGANGGIFVAAPSLFVRLGRKMLELSGETVSVADSLAVRNCLDPLVIVEATRHRSARDLEELRELAEAMGAPELEWKEYLRLNWALHRRMVEITPNRVLRHTYLSLLDFVESRLQSVVADVPERGHEDGVRVHREIVEAIASEDVERAARAAASHSDLVAGR